MTFESDMLSSARAGKWQQVRECVASVENTRHKKLYLHFHDPQYHFWTLADYAFYQMQFQQSTEARDALIWLNQRGVYANSLFIPLEIYGDKNIVGWQWVFHFLAQAPNQSTINMRHPQKWNLLHYALNNHDHNMCKKLMSQYQLNIDNTIMHCAQKELALWDQIFFAIEHQLVSPDIAIHSGNERWSLKAYAAAQGQLDALNAAYERSKTSHRPPSSVSCQPNLLPEPLTIGFVRGVKNTPPSSAIYDDCDDLDITALLDQLDWDAPETPRTDPAEPLNPVDTTSPNIWTPSFSTLHKTPKPNSCEPKPDESTSPPSNENTQRHAQQRYQGRKKYQKPYYRKKNSPQVDKIQPHA